MKSKKLDIKETQSEFQIIKRLSEENTKLKGYKSSILSANREFEEKDFKAFEMEYINVKFKFYFNDLHKLLHFFNLK